MKAYQCPECAGTVRAFEYVLGIPLGYFAIECDVCRWNNKKLYEHPPTASELKEEGIEPIPKKQIRKLGLRGAR